MSVLHFAIKQTGSETIKNKTELLFHVGFRKFRAKPIFSEHTSGSKHKMERFFPKEGVTIATVFAPIMFPPANVLVFKDSPGKMSHGLMIFCCFTVTDLQLFDNSVNVTINIFLFYSWGLPSSGDWSTL